MVLVFFSKNLFHFDGQLRFDGLILADIEHGVLDHHFRK